MQDMLVKLYELPDHSALIQKLKNDSIDIRRPLAAEKSLTLEWISKYFGTGWASEADVSFSYQPITCFIAVCQQKIIGFACYDSCYRNFFGPTGVDESFRSKGIGKALLFECLQGMLSQGYAYGIIGGVGPAEFYEKTCGAIMIPGSDPGIYKGILSEVPLE
ncbi:MAG: GNAT family N-acetyltransferase [Bacteroidetes bacterium]|nr:GNAT family N-acetyltransferase [Bacteroidota bacterium]MDA1122034.1 GNAT family N-acetyltransferase [Bacteroidota bacterium]